MDAGTQAEALMGRDIDTMNVGDVDKEIEEISRGGVEWMPFCVNCRTKHAVEIISQEDGDVKLAVLLVHSGNLKIQRFMLPKEGRSVLHGRFYKADVKSLLEAKFDVKEVIRGLYLFIEQEKMMRMCGGIKPALA